VSVPFTAWARTPRTPFPFKKINLYFFLIKGKGVRGVRAYFSLVFASKTHNARFCCHAVILPFSHSEVWAQAQALFSTLGVMPAVMSRPAAATKRPATALRQPAAASNPAGAQPAGSTAGRTEPDGPTGPFESGSSARQGRAKRQYTWWITFSYPYPETVARLNPRTPDKLQLVSALVRRTAVSLPTCHPY